jgi:hypothetical protein
MREGRSLFEIFPRNDNVKCIFSGGIHLMWMGLQLTADFTIDRMDLILQPTGIPIKTRFSLLIFK